MNWHCSNTRLLVDLHCRRQARHGNGSLGRVLLKIVYMLACRILGLIVVLAPIFERDRSFHGAPVVSTPGLDASGRRSGAEHR